MFKRIAIGILLICIIFLGASIFIIRQHYALPVLMYHQILSQPQKGYMLAVSVKAFQRQMAFLRAHHYNIVFLEDAARLIKEKKQLPAKTIVVTMDDGYRNNYTNAYPVLKKYKIPVTIFLIANEVGRYNKNGMADRLTWEEINQMQRSGLVKFGSHTLGPEPLVNMKQEEDLRREIFDSKKILENKLGCSVNAFSYPEGLFNAHIRNLVIDAGYNCAVATNPGKRFSNNDIFALKRLRIAENCANIFVFWVETSGYYNFIREHQHKHKR